MNDAKLVITTITGKNQVTLPAELVKILGLKSGTRLDWSLQDERTLVARPPPTRGELARELQNMMKEYIVPGKSAVEGLLQDRDEDDVLALATL